MISAYLKLRFFHFLKQFKNWKLLLRNIFIIGGGIFYGFICSLFPILMKEKGIESFDNQQVIFYSGLIMAFISFMRIIRPYYQPLEENFPKYYPTSKFQNFASTIIKDYSNPFFLYFIFLIGSFSVLFSDLFNGLILFFVLISAMFFGNFTRRILQYGIDFKWNIKNRVLIFLIFTFLLTSYYLSFKFNFSIGYMITMILAGILAYIIDSKVKYEDKKSTNSRLLNNSFYLKFLLNNQKIRKPLLVGVFMKIAIIVGDFLLFKYTGEHLFRDMKFYYWIFVSPLMVFTYVFNNQWGYWFSVWSNIEIRSGNYFDFVKFVLNILKYPMLIDAIITLGLLSFMNHENGLLFIYLFYLLSTLLLTSFSFLWSIVFPIKVKSKFRTRGATSMWTVFFSMFSIGILSQISFSPIGYLIIGLSILLTIAAFIFAKSIYEERRYKVFEKVTVE